MVYGLPVSDIPRVEIVKWKIIVRRQSLALVFEEVGSTKVQLPSANQVGEFLDVHEAPDRDILVRRFNRPKYGSIGIG